MNLGNQKRQLTIFLILVAIHSLCVGIALILFPPSYLEVFGFHNYSFSFFQVQGGVFHIVMFVAYLMAIKYMHKSAGLIYFSIFAKSIATVFLIIYYLFIENSWMIIMSAFGDAVMAAILFILYKRFHINNSN